MPEQEANAIGAGNLAAKLHDHTYGITSDPLTHFACALSALIHDADHRGVPNSRLIVEQPLLAERYKNRSVAEQNSFDLAWDLLMQDDFASLRTTLCPTPSDLQRLRQLVINSVMATDIMDKGLKELRNARWDKAFKTGNPDKELNNPGSSTTPTLSEGTSKDAVDRKATIVIEHLIQASDVAHTMQHWHVYRKWNERLLEEMYVAYVQGRSSQDPTVDWYKGEIGFFDFYIIPLAKKLKDCGVFGKSSDEYLNYAERNRAEWVEQGELVVAEMVDTLHEKHGTSLSA